MDIFGFKELTRFEITGGVVAGIDKLEFRVFNNGRGSTGLLEADLTGSASEIPLPDAIWLLGSGLVAMIGIRSRMKH